jgi:hypothetical protein
MWWRGPDRGGCRRLVAGGLDLAGVAGHRRRMGEDIGARLDQVTCDRAKLGSRTFSDLTTWRSLSTDLIILDLEQKPAIDFRLTGNSGYGIHCVLKSEFRNRGILSSLSDARKLR